MRMTDDDDTVHCDVQMPLAQGRELLQLVITLRESNNFTASMEQLTLFRGHSLQSGFELVDDPPVARQVWHGIL